MRDRYDKGDVNARQGDVSFYVDMRPATLLEVNLNDGYSRTTKPVGNADPKKDEFHSAGGRGTADAVEAIKLGSNGRKK